LWLTQSKLMGLATDSFADSTGQVTDLLA
jgi:hypothetical protein